MLPSKLINLLTSLCAKPSDRLVEAVMNSLKRGDPVGTPACGQVKAVWPCGAML